MERRFEIRKAEMLLDCEVSPEVFREMTQRLEKFAEPFVTRLGRSEQQTHAKTYLEGLVSDIERKNAESIAYRHDEDRLGLQTFLAVVPWDYGPLIDELAAQVGRELGEADGVIVFDPSAFAKKGRHSVGVARQWCGRLGKVENCQVGVFMGYVSRQDHALVDMRLFLPQEWTNDRKRCRECGGGPGRPRVSRRGTSWRWRCSRLKGRDCRMGGSPETTKWAVRPAFVSVWRRRGSVTCWPFPAIR